jgi:hypothetical protein
MFAQISPPDWLELTAHISIQRHAIDAVFYEAHIRGGEEEEDEPLIISSSS